MDAREAPAFVVDDDPQVDWPVRVQLPVDGGKYEIFEFSARFRVFSEDGWKELLADSSPEPLPLPMSEQLKINADRFARVVVDWSGPKDKAGNAVPFSVMRLVQEVTGPRGVWLSIGLYTAISEVRYGARLGNSAPPSAAG